MTYVRRKVYVCSLMNDYLLSAMLGIVEGLTEFLPVSSTAHLRIFQALFGIDLGSGYWKMYSIVIQSGAILCLPLYFRCRIAQLLRTFPQGSHGRNNIWNHPLTLTIYAFVCTMLLSLLSIKFIGKHLENVLLMAYALIIGGVVMWIVDAIYGVPRLLSAKSADAGGAQYKTDSVDAMTITQAILIGCCQTLAAVFPGISRSMSTIAAGQIAGMSRPAALEFSFFLSIPTMIAATGYDMFKSICHNIGGSEIGVGPSNTHEWIVLAIGFVVSFIVAYAVVAWFMIWVRKRGFVPFAIYRIVLGIFVCWWATHQVIS